MLVVPIPFQANSNRIFPYDDFPRHRRTFRQHHGASVHIADQVSIERDAATHAALHRLSVMLNDCQRQISDLLKSASPELRGKIDALIVRESS
jgi:hypothetical protein